MRSKLLPALLIFTFFSVAVFGFLGVSAMEMEHGGNSTCLFSVFTGNESCISLQSTVAVAAHYLDMAGWLSGALASFDIFALVFLLIFLFILFVAPSFSLASPALSRLFSVTLRSFFVKEKTTLLRWLAYHNKRGLSVLARVRISVV